MSPVRGRALGVRLPLFTDSGASSTPLDETIEGQEIVALDQGSLSHSDYTAKKLEPRSLTIEWLTTKQAAEYLCLSKGAFLNMVSNGQIPFYKLGRRNRYRLLDLRELLLTQKRGALNGN